MQWRVNHPMFWALSYYTIEPFGFQDFFKDSLYGSWHILSNTPNFFCTRILDFADPVCYYR
jgi:lysyl-tRNA synthetase class I